MEDHEDQVRDTENEAQEGAAEPVDPASRLTPAENELLDFEESWRQYGRTKAEAIATRGVSSTRYYLALNRVLANPYARLERPELVGRLLRLRARRARERGSEGGLL